MDDKSESPNEGENKEPLSNEINGIDRGVNSSSNEEVASNNQKVEGDAHTTEWVDSIHQLPEISHREVLDKLRAGEVIENYKLPFIKIDQAQFDVSVQIRNCFIQGLLAKGCHFGGDVTFDNCYFEERFQISALKEDGRLQKTAFDGSLRLENCYFQDKISARNIVVKNHVVFTNSRNQDTFIWDQSEVQGNFLVLRNSKIGLFSFFRGNVGGSVEIKNCQFSDREGSSLDFNKIRVEGSIVMRDSSFPGDFLWNRAFIGENAKSAWMVFRCSFGKIELQETRFCGQVEISGTNFNGEIIGDIPRIEHGKRAGNAVLFEGDASFIESNFQEKVSLSGSRFKKYCNIRHCNFAKDLNFNKAEFYSILSFWETTVTKDVRFRKSRFEDKVTIANTSLGPKSSFNESLFRKDVNVYNSEVQGDAFFTGAQFEGHLSMRKVKIYGGLAMKDVLISGNFAASSIRIEDRFIFTQGKVEGDFNLPGITIGTWGSLVKCVIRGSCDMQGVKVGTNVPKDAQPDPKTGAIPGSLYLEEGIFHGNIYLNNVIVEGSLTMCKVSTHAELDMSSARIKHQLDLSESYWRGIFLAPYLQCEDMLNAYKSRFKEEADFYRLKCKYARFSKSNFDNNLSLRDSQIEETLSLNGTDIDGKIDLTKVEAGKLYFRHLLTEHLLISRATIQDGISAEKEGNYLQAMEEYGTLARSFLIQSKYPDMDWAYYNFCRMRRRNHEKSGGFFRKLVSFSDWLFLDKGFGYGTKPLNLAGVAFFVVLFFTFFILQFPTGLIGPTGEILESISFFDAFYMSTLSFAAMDYGNCFPDFNHWLKHLIALEGLIGICLITLFIATFSRKIIRT